jgi:hypothetical protein
MVDFALDRTANPIRPLPLIMGLKQEKMSASTARTGEESDFGSADEVLGTLGYTPELARNRSTIQVAFMSFVLAAIPYGLATTLYYPLNGGGPVDIIWGWVAVSLIIICVAASLGEITSVYPTAGGVYYQTWMLAPPRWRNLAAWVCGWLYVVGNITITLSVNFGTTLFLVACINVFETSEGEPVFAGEAYQVFLIFLGITFLCNAVSSLCNKWLPILDVSYHELLFVIRAWLTSLQTDICHFLDIRWRCCHHGLRTRHRKERPSRCRLCFHPFRGQFWMDTWMVFHGWTSSCRLCHFIYWHDHLVSDFKPESRVYKVN